MALGEGVAVATTTSLATTIIPQEVVDPHVVDTKVVTKVEEVVPRVDTKVVVTKVPKEHSPGATPGEEVEEVVVVPRTTPPSKGRVTV